MATRSDQTVYSNQTSRLLDGISCLLFPDGSLCLEPAGADSKLKIFDGPICLTPQQAAALFHFLQGEQVQARMTRVRRRVLDREYRRLKRIMDRDFHADPRPSYPQMSADNLDPEQRAALAAEPAAVQELVTQTADLLSEVHPKDRRFLLYTIDAVANDRRAQRKEHAA